MSDLTDDSPMPFGKYEGTAMINVPAEYLLWLLEENKTNFKVKRYIVDNLDVLRAEKAGKIIKRKS